MQRSIQITRAGCLAVHLMPTYTGRRLSNAVKFIMAHGPRNDVELEAVNKANAETLPDKQIPTEHKP